jgi:hypothetical protein
MILNDELLNSLSTISVQLNVNHIESLSYRGLDGDEYEKLLKEKLVRKLIDGLMNSNHIEFTAQEDTNQMSRIYRARVVTANASVIGKLRKESII